MGWKDFFKKKAGKESAPLTDISLSELKPGYLVDWDLKTWEVASYSYYDWGDSKISHEWQLKASDETLYLEFESDDEDFWSISKKISFTELKHGIKEMIIKNGDPPDQITFKGVKYYLEESGGGHFFKNKSESGQELISWDYEDEDGKKFLTIEQWGENRFEASIGFPVEEYQFTDILPGEMKK